MTDCSSASGAPSSRLEKLYEEYKVRHLGHGKQGDALGDVYEEFVEEIFTDDSIRDSFNKGEPRVALEERIFFETLSPYGVTYITKVSPIEVPKRGSGGAPKTDVHLLVNGSVGVKLSVKHSSSKNVAAAEFDVETIRREVGIHDPTVIHLMRKHQRDASAKHFTPAEKAALTAGLVPVKERLVRWVLSGSPEVSSDDPRFANHTIMFKVGADKEYKGFSTYRIEEQVKEIIRGRAGFGTGLSWTYATGTKGKKIQFKCPVR